MSIDPCWYESVSALRDSVPALSAGEATGEDSMGWLCVRFPCSTRSGESDQRLKPAPGLMVVRLVPEGLWVRPLARAASSARVVSVAS